MEEAGALEKTEDSGADFHAEGGGGVSAETAGEALPRGGEVGRGEGVFYKAKGFRGGLRAQGIGETLCREGWATGGGPAGGISKSLAEGDRGSGSAGDGNVGQLFVPAGAGICAGAGVEPGGGSAGRGGGGARVKKARKEHEISLLRSIEVAGEKSWRAKAWLAERVYSYAVPSSRLEVAGAIAHAHGATPALAQLLAGMNSTKSVDGIGNGALQLIDREGGKLSGSIGQKRKVRRLSQRPTRPPHGDGQTPTAVRHAYTPPEKF